MPICASALSAMRSALIGRVTCETDKAPSALAAQTNTDGLPLPTFVFKGFQTLCFIGLGQT